MANATNLRSDEGDQIQKQFLRSLRRHVSNRAATGSTVGPTILNAPDVFGPVSAAVAARRGGASKWQHVLDAGLRPILNIRAASQVNDLSAAIDKCESPPEALMMIAIETAALCQCMYVAYVVDGRRLGDTGEDWQLTVEPQAQVGEFRVDFLLTFRCLVDSDVVGSDPRRGRTRVQMERRVVVEVDGHDYHEKTPAQARRHKSRDRELLKAGYTVMRFTGADVWADAFGMALDVINQLHRLAFEASPMTGDRIL